MAEWNTGIDDFLTKLNTSPDGLYTDRIGKLDKFVNNKLPLMNGGMQKREHDQKNIQKGGEIDFSEFYKKIDSLSNPGENYTSRITKLGSFVDDDLNEFLNQFVLYMSLGQLSPHSKHLLGRQKASKHLSR